MAKLTMKQKREIVNTQLFQNFKTQDKPNKATIKKEVRWAVKGKPVKTKVQKPKAITNVAIIPSTYLIPINYFELDYTLTQLKDEFPRLQAKVTTISFGSSPVFLLDGYNYNNVKFIVDNIGIAAEHMSGVYEFIPIVERNGNYLDFVLGNEDGFGDDEDIVEPIRNKRQARTEAEITERAIGTQKIAKKRARKIAKEKAVKRSRSSLLKDPEYIEANKKYKESVKRAEKLLKNKDIEQDDYKVLLRAAADRKAKVVERLNKK
jgi:hypothetical protein